MSALTYSQHNIQSLIQCKPWDIEDVFINSDHYLSSMHQLSDEQPDIAVTVIMYLLKKHDGDMGAVRCKLIVSGYAHACGNVHQKSTYKSAFDMC